MASAAYYTWVNKGKPYTLTKPLRELKECLEGFGYTVYDYPDEAHQTAEPPEDHTPYSATEWPVQISGYVAHAIDIMPPDASALAQGAVPLPVLARRIIAQRDARVPGTLFLKYENWTDEKGVCRHESWKTTPRTTTSSTDKGHIHLSARTDTEDYSIGDWNPVMAVIWDQGDENVAWATTNRVNALLADLDEATFRIVGESADRHEVNVAKKRQVEQFNQLMVQVKANATALAELKALVSAGGIDPEVLRQIVADEVAKLIKATRLSLG